MFNMCDCAGAEAAGLNAMVRDTLLGGSALGERLRVTCCPYCDKVLAGLSYDSEAA